jgi:hypothetical protein
LPREPAGLIRLKVTGMTPFRIRPPSIFASLALTKRRNPEKSCICVENFGALGVHFSRSSLAALLGCGAVIGAASAQLSPVDRTGVKHFVTAAIVPAQTGNEPGPRISGLQVIVRISDHIREAQFFGNVPVTWPEFAASEGAPQRTIWEDKQCHQRRGLPTATVIAIDGMLETDQSRLAILARHRHIGLRLPSNEITQAQSLPGGRDDLGRYLAFRIETAGSHVSVLLKMYVADCALM